MFIRQGIILFLLCFRAIAFSQHVHDYTEQSKYVYPTDQKVVSKIKAWKELKFGMIIHWGTYSQWGVIESWSICPEDSDFIKRTGPYGGNWYEYKKAYENLQTTFNPQRFAPENWASLAKNAGMKYVIFTTKHHDGFNMFDTKYSDYKITSPKTPFSVNSRSNITNEVFKAFRKEGFMIGAYFSKPDWHSEDYWWSYFPPKNRNPSYDTQKYANRWTNFKTFTYNQIEELTTNYGGIDILWLDGGQVHPPKQDIDMPKIAAMARKNQPGLLVVDRTVSGEYENYITPEQKIPEQALNVPWESCITIGDSWSYKPNDNYKSTASLVKMLCEVVAKGGNLLLNVGPDANGILAPEVIERLSQIGAWMDVNNEAIFNSQPIMPYRHGNWAFTMRGKNTYAIFLPDEKIATLSKCLTLTGIIPKKGSKIQLLGTKTELKWKIENSQINIILPKNVLDKLPCKYAWVFKVSPE